MSNSGKSTKDRGGRARRIEWEIALADAYLWTVFVTFGGLAIFLVLARLGWV